jgi:hypothetical protein
VYVLVLVDAADYYRLPREDLAVLLYGAPTSLINHLSMPRTLRAVRCRGRRTRKSRYSRQVPLELRSLRRMHTRCWGRPTVPRKGMGPVEVWVKWTVYTRIWLSESRARLVASFLLHTVISNAFTTSSVRGGVPFPSPPPTESNVEDKGEAEEALPSAGARDVGFPEQIGCRGGVATARCLLTRRWPNLTRIF